MSLGVFMRSPYVFSEMCGDFLISGVLTFRGSADRMLAKITRPEHIYKGLNATHKNNQVQHSWTV